MNILSLDKMLIVQLANWLNMNKETIGFPCDILINTQKNTSKQLWLQPLGGTNKLKSYFGGSYLGQFSFAIYFQMPDLEINGEYAKLDVPFWNISNFLDKKPNIEFENVENVTIEMTGTPSIFSKTESGMTISQAIFILNYLKKR